MANDGSVVQRRAGKRLTPPKWVWAIVALLGLAIVILRVTDLLGDHAFANMATWILTFLAVLVVLGWWLLRSGLSRRVRLAIVAGAAVAVAGFCTLFRVDHVSGELVPSFAYRFAPKPDQQMAPVTEEAGEHGPPVDLGTTTPDDFPQFLGPGRTAALEGVRLDLDARWPPPLVWRHAIGAGWSGFAVRNGHAVTMEQRDELEMVTCYDVRTGRLEWWHGTATRHETTPGGVGPRCTPTIDHGKVFALGATGRLSCLDGATGRCLWEKDLLQEFGVTPEEELAAVAWGRAASPLVVGERVIVPAGGMREGHPVSLAAFDVRDGHLVWQAGQRQVGYSSPALATLAGVEQVLIVNEDTASGHDPRTGRVLWEHEWEGHSNRDPNVSQAVPVPPDRVFLSKGYAQGAMLLRLVPRPATISDGARYPDGAFDTEVVWHNPKVMRTKFSNVTLRDGRVYGLSDGTLECIDLESGQRIWKDGRYHHGQILRVGEALMVMSEWGEVVFVEATPDRPNHVLGRFQALEGMSWNTVALAGRYLLVRNAAEAACYRLGN
jgi:outer membrane protein assembly factor BamB